MSKSKSKTVAKWAVACALVGIPVGAVLFLEARNQYEAERQPFKHLKNKTYGRSSGEFNEFALQGATIGLVAGAGLGTMIGVGVVATTVVGKAAASATITVAETLKHRFLGKANDVTQLNNDAKNNNQDRPSPQ